MLQLSQFGWTLHSWVKVVFNKFLLIDETDRNIINSDQKRLFFDVSLYPLSFFANTPFKGKKEYLAQDIDWLYEFYVENAGQIAFLKNRGALSIFIY